MELKVIKRDKSEESFKREKIVSAIKKAFIGTDTIYTDEILETLSLRVFANFSKDVKNNKIEIEKIQDNVEQILGDMGFSNVARSYILYRNNHEKLRVLKSTMIDFKNVMDNYLGQSDWRVKENSTVTYSIGGLILHNSGAVTANYWLSEVYDKEISEAHKNGDLHLHDLSMLSAYCAGWSLRQLIEEGLGGIPGKITSAPAKHLSTLVNQMVNFLGILQNEWAGAQAFSSFDTYLSPFIKVDKMPYEQVKQCIQSFVFGVNTPSRWGTQSPFSNITLDWTVPDDLKDKNVIVGGKELDFKYADCQEEMNMLNKAFIEVMMEGDADGRGFQYPIPTYNITKDFIWDAENTKLLFDMAAKYGTPYFQNFVNSDLNPSDVRSMCCRLQLDKRELRKKGGGLFGADEYTGSIGVVTINMPRLAYQSLTKEEFYIKLSHIMDIAKRSLEVKRKVIEKLNKEGLFPYTKRYLKDFHNHFSTIGLLGMNEACLNSLWIKKDLTDKEGQDFTKEVLEFMRKRIADYQEETGFLYNLEATPAESTSFRLAKIDKAKYADIITSGEKFPYYTNSSNLPVSFTEDIFDAMDIQEGMQKLYTGGTVFHVFLGEKISDWEVAKNLLKKIVYNYKIPYITLSPTYSICKNHGYIIGEKYNCPHCGTETEVYSRITGYYRPVKYWNDGKSEEFKDRKEYASDYFSKELNFKMVNEIDEEIADNRDNVIKYLFTTNDCPNCPTAKNELSEINDIEVINAQEMPDLAIKYKIRGVPSLVIKNILGIKTYTGVHEIIKWKKQYSNNL